MNASGEPITKCPVCRYDLNGLPKNHTCPECGFEYDETMRLWRTQWKARWPWLMIGFFTMIMISHLVSLLQRGFLPGLKLLGDVFLIAYWIVILYCWRWSDSFVIVGNSALVYKFPVRSTKTLPWNQVDFPDQANRPRKRVGKGFRFLILPVSTLSSIERGIVYQLIRSHVNRSSSISAASAPLR